MRFIILINFILVLFSSISYSAIYEWKNKQGNTAYTQAPPSDKSIKTRKLEVKAQRVNEYVDPDEVGTENDGIDSSVTNEETDVSPEEQAKRIAEGKKLINEQCSNAKSALAGLEGGNRLYKDSKGDYLRMTEKEKNKRRKNINSFIDEHCK